MALITARHMMPHCEGAEGNNPDAEVKPGSGKRLATQTYLAGLPDEPAVWGAPPLGIWEVAGIINGGPGVVRVRLNYNMQVSSMVAPVADKLGLRRQRAPEDGCIGTLIRHTFTSELSLEPLLVELVDQQGTSLVEISIPVVHVTPEPDQQGPFLYELQLGRDVLSRCSAPIDHDPRGLNLSLGPSSPPITIPWLLPRQGEAIDGSSTFFVNAATLQAARDLVQARTTYLIGPPGEVAAWGSSQGIPEVAGSINGGPGVVRVRANVNMSVSSMTAPIADKLGLRHVPAPYNGSRSLLGRNNFTPDMLLEPVHIKLLDRAGRGIADVTCDIMYVTQSDDAQGPFLYEVQLGRDDLSQLGGSVGYGMTELRLGAVTAPCLVARAGDAVCGSSTFSVDEATHQAARWLLETREAVRTRRQQGLPSSLQELAETAAQVWSVEPADGLPPLPPGLVAQGWAVLQATHLPQDSTMCSVCHESMTPNPRLVQLSCHHTYCEVCLREYVATCRRAGWAGACPCCRGPIA